MIICKSCCEKTCASFKKCPIVKSPQGFASRAFCSICKEWTDVASCLTYITEHTNSNRETDRFLSLLRPVAETLADRERKYGGTYQKLRREAGIGDPTGFLWEVRKKLARYKEALARGEYETAWDSMLDVAGYCALEMELLQFKTKISGVKISLNTLRKKI